MISPPQRCSSAMSSLAGRTRLCSSVGPDALLGDGLRTDRPAVLSMVAARYFVLVW